MECKCRSNTTSHDFTRVTQQHGHASTSPSDASTGDMMRAMHGTEQRCDVTTPTLPLARSGGAWICLPGRLNVKNSAVAANWGYAVRSPCSSRVRAIIEIVLSVASVQGACMVPVAYA